MLRFVDGNKYCTAHAYIAITHTDHPMTNRVCPGADAADGDSLRLAPGELTATQFEEVLALAEKGDSEKVDM